MPLNFPLNPAPGATHTFNGTTYIYTKGSWNSLSSNYGNVIINEDSALKRKKIAQKLVCWFVVAMQKVDLYEPQIRQL